MLHIDRTTCKCTSLWLSVLKLGLPVFRVTGKNDFLSTGHCVVVVTFNIIVTHAI